MKLEAYVAGGVGQDTALLRKLAEIAGGYTVQPSFGGWIDDDGNLVEEQSSAIVLFGLERPLLDAQRAIVDFARSAGESAVLFVWSDSYDDIVSTGVKVGRA